MQINCKFNDHGFSLIILCVIGLKSQNNIMDFSSAVTLLLHNDNSCVWSIFLISKHNCWRINNSSIHSLLCFIGRMKIHAVFTVLFFKDSVLGFFQAKIYFWLLYLYKYIYIWLCIWFSSSTKFLYTKAIVNKKSKLVEYDFAELCWSNHVSDLVLMF